MTAELPQSDPSSPHEPLVLVADDAPIAVDLLCGQLRQFGYERLKIARDGEEAVYQTAALRPDLVFLDIDMPRKTGLVALREIKSFLPDTFVCMLSAHSSATNVRTALQAGANGFLVKPCQLARLQHVLNEFRKRWTSTAGESSLSSKS